MANITLMDVQKLTTEPSTKVRSQLAAKLAMDYSDGNFNESESTIAAEIFRILLKDVEKQVRQTLSEHLSRCPTVPHDIAMTIARDITEVAVPMLEYSSVLTDSDLMAIVASTQEVLKHTAIARREHVSKPVADILLDTHNEETLSALLGNKGATLSEYSLMTTWDYVSSHPRLMEALVHRGGLPLTIAEKMYHAVTDEMKTHLTRQYKIAAPVALKTTSDTREWEMLGLVPSDGAIDTGNDEQVEDMVDQLFLGNRLTHSFIMRSLCVGALSVFETGVARLARVPRVNARVLLMDSGALGFHAIYKAAAMPEGFAEAVRILLRIALEETDFGRSKNVDFRKRVIDRIYIEGYNRSIENMEYLIAIVGGKIAAAGVH